MREKGLLLDDPALAYHTGTVYNDNFEYDINEGVTTLAKVYNSEGYVESANYNYYRKDHLGDNREVWNANTNATVQYTQYYASGLPMASNPTDNADLQQKKYNGKEFIQMHGLDEYDSQARMYYPAIMRTPTLDSHAEKYYSTSPYVWCFNNPLRFQDKDGKDPGKLDDWIEFGKKLYEASTAILTVGFQVAGEAKIASKPIGVNLNAVSVDIVGVRDGNFTPGKNTPQVRKDAEVGIGVVGVSYNKTVTDNGKTSTVEEKTSAGTIFGQIEHKTTTEVKETKNGNYQQVGKTTSKTTANVPDIQVKGALIFGIELSVDPNKVWNALSHLIYDK